MLTDKQQSILHYIKEYQLDNGYSPTFKDIQKHFGFSSLNSVFKHLKALETKGYIRKNNRARGIELLEEVKDTLFSDETSSSIPLFGQIPAGDPTTVEGNTVDYINVSQSLVPTRDGVFLLEVTGDSMNNTGIIEGDIVIVDSKKTPRDGNIVVALVDGANTLKKYILKSHKAHLIPDSDNPRHSEIIPLH